MTQISLRSALRDATSDLHDRLDSQVGSFADLDAYRRYLAGTWRFRSALEPALDPVQGWQSQPIVPLIAADMADLDLCDGNAPSGAPGWSGDAALLGVHYVVEGSSVGARLLLRRAGQLGLDGTRGARHLAGQAADTGRWPRFLALLDQSQGVDHARAAEAARETFALAISMYASNDR